MGAACCCFFAAWQKTGGASRGKVRSRPYADPYSTWTDELPGELDVWNDDEEARRLIYEDSLSDIVR